LDVAELVLHELADAGRAVDTRDDRDVVPRANPPVLALVTVEVAHLARGVYRHRPHVDADLVPVGGQLTDVEIVGVHVLPSRDVLGGEADHLAVSPYRVTPADGTAGDLVAGVDVLFGFDLAAAVLDHQPPVEGRFGNGDVVLGLQHDRAVRKGSRSGHGPSNIPWCTPRGSPAIFGLPMAMRPVVLAVDDDPRVLDAYQAILEARCEVLTASDGRSALEILQTRTIDVVLLDMLMPGMNGLAVLEARNRLGIETNVVVVSGMNDTLTALEALRLGASDYLSKPFDVGHLHRVIARLTQDAGSPEAAAARAGSLPHALIVSENAGLRAG